MARRGLTVRVLGTAIVLIVTARLAFPAAPPLYDGIVPNEPYVWLDPPPGDPGGAKGATADIPIQGGKSPLVAIATPELVPQAQIFAPPATLVISPGARSVKVSIEPVAPQGVPSDGHIDGNVYRMIVVDDKGTALTAPASARVSIVLRGTDLAMGDATIARFTDGTWQSLKTSPSGFGGTFLAVVTEFGDFAVIAPGPGPSLSSTGEPGASTAASETLSAASTTPVGVPPASDVSGGPIWLVAAAVAVVGLLAVLYLVASRRR
jgi:hypothetical protein